MIIFYNKKSGEIVGTLSGRIHSEKHLNMWIGDESENGRIICNWKPTRFYKKDGSIIPAGSKAKPYSADFAPDHPQQDIFSKLEKSPTEYLNYKINLKTKKLVKN